MIRICALGLFRSGTNFTRALLELNYDCIVQYDSFGWKHGFFPILNHGSGLQYPDDGIVVVTKNPFSSLKSLFDYASTGQPNFFTGHKDSFKDFLSAPVTIMNGGDPSSAELHFSTPVDYWASMHWNLESVIRKRPRTVHVRYEDILEFPERETARIAETFGIGRGGDAFQIPEKKMKNLGNNQHDKTNFTRNKLFDSSALKAHAYMSAYDGSDRASIIKAIDKGLIDRLGYTALMAELTQLAPAAPETSI